MRTISDYRPERIEYIGYGIYRFYWNITEKEIESSENSPAHVVYESDYVEVDGEPNADNITSAAITALCDVNREQKLINEYNAAKMGLYDKVESEAKIKAYEDYLSERMELKASIDSYFNE